MKFVVDTNVLFSWFWPDSAFSSLIEKHFCISPEFSLEELESHSEEIMKKVNISRKIYKQRKRDLTEHIDFVPLEDYSDMFHTIKESLTEELKDEFLKDIDFLALAAKTGFPVWSNDRKMAEQNVVPVFSTTEVIKLF